VYCVGVGAAGADAGGAATGACTAEGARAAWTTGPAVEGVEAGAPFVEIVPVGVVTGSP
jgi:hypothetical protein